nr:MAG TPA: tail fiber assembly protein [Caudoviricetes sp.]
MYFFDNHINAFLVEGLHDIPVDAIAVSDNEYEDLVAKRDIGCLLYVDDNQVKATPPQPSPAHEWDGKAWVISPAKMTALFAEQKESLIAQLANKTDALKAGLLVGYPQTEIDSFYRQEKEALAWQADHNAETPMLKQIALLRGVPFEILVQKVIEKSEMFAMVIGAIIGQRQQLEDRILTATKPEELETIKNEVETWQLPNLS